MKISAYTCDYNLDPPDDDEPESDVEEEVILMSMRLNLKAVTTIHYHTIHLNN